ncbi:MAG: DNA repair protein RecO [Armatimonadetes bacterium]|nr:DNA repair protein RecO [Armatimonadota bacterium]
MALYRANAIVLRRRSFEETDKLLVLYTREYGKLSAVAKGARRSQSRLVGATEPLVYARMQLAEGRNLDIVSEATPRHSFSGIRSSQRKIEYGLYLLELTEALVEERQPSHELFDLLLSSLYLLESRSSLSAVVRRFELQALDAVGYTPEMDRCVVCQARRPPARAAAFSASHGGIVCTRCRAGVEDVVLASGAVLDGMKSLARLPAHQVGALDLTVENLRDVAKLTRKHISFHVGRDLKAGSVVATSEAHPSAD